MTARSFTRLERFELKYHVPIHYAEAIARHIAPYCEQDAYSACADDGFYWVTTLYLDTPQWLFYRWRVEGLPDRFQMRIRAYGESPESDGPRFFEIKRKRGDIVTKDRGTLLGGQSAAVFSELPETWPVQTEKDRRNLMEFYRKAQTYGSQPRLLTQYKRCAWFGIYEDYARVTIDTTLRYREEQGFDFSVDSKRMLPSGLPEYFTPGTDAVLELKCLSSQVPFWMIDLIRSLNLQRGSFSKYGAAVREYHRLFGMAPVVRVPVAG